MSLHHPGAVSEVRDGAMYADKLEWSRQLKLVHRNIIETTIRNKMRQNKQRNSRLARDYYLSSELARLGAEVVYQLDKTPADSRLGDVTQLVELDETQAGQAPAAKRRRLSGDGAQTSALDILVEEIIKSVDLEEMKIPWLQILSVLYSEHPDVVWGHEETFLEVLSDQMSAIKCPAVREQLCGILSNLCDGSGCGQPGWAGLAHSVLSLLGGNQLALDGHRLLRALLDHHDSVILKPQDVLRVYRNKLVKLDMNSTQTLATVIAKFPINDVRDPKLREDLMSWISSQLVSEHNPLSDEALVHPLSNLINHLTYKHLNAPTSESEAVKLKKSSVNSRIDQFEERLMMVLCIRPLQPKDMTLSNDHSETKTPKMMASADQLFVIVAAHILDNLQTKKEQGVRAGCHFLQLLASHLSVSCSPHHAKIQSLTINVFNDVQKALSKYVNLKEEGASEKMLTVLLSASAMMGSMSRASLGPETRLSNIFVVKLKENVKEICKAKEALDVRPSSRSRSHSRDTTPDPLFDDFENMDSGSTNDEFADFDMPSQNNPEKDSHDINFICECLKILTLYSIFSQDRAKTQMIVIELLNEVLSVYDYIIQITEAMITVLDELVQIGIEREVVIKTGDLFKDLAKICMTKSSFRRHGIYALTRCMTSLIPSLFEFDVQTRSICVKILETLMKHNCMTDNKRLDDGIVMNIVRVIEKLSVLGAGADWAVWSAHNSVAPDLAVDTDERLPICLSLPGFLLSQYSSVRALAAGVIVKLAEKTEERGALLRRRLLPVMESNNLFGDTHSALLAAMGCINITFAVPATSTLIRIQAQNRKGFNKDQLNRAIDLIKSTFEVDILKASLPVSIEEYLRFGFKLDSFPISLYGYQQTDQLVMFIEDHETEIVPLILLQEPRKKTLDKVAALFKRSPEEVMRNNFAFAARYFLPGMVAQDGNYNIEGKERCIKLANFVESIQIPDDDGDRTDSFVFRILKYLKSTIAQIFLAVNDSAAMANTFAIERQEQIPVGPLELPSDMPSRVMNLLGRNTERNIWEEITVVNSYYMAKIAISIISTLSEKESAENNLRSVFSLYLWIDSISSKFTEKMNHLLTFLIKYISNHLLKLLNISSSSQVKKMEDLSKAILLTLFKLLKFSMEIDASTIKSSLKNINYGLINCVIKSSWKEETSLIAIEILNFLLIQNGTRY